MVFLLPERKSSTILNSPKLNFATQHWCCQGDSESPPAGEISLKFLNSKCCLCCECCQRLLSGCLIDDIGDVRVLLGQQLQK